MIHAREDYNRFQDPAIEDPSLLGEGCTPIWEDEPVILFRAKDRHFIGVLEAYDAMLAADYDEGAGIRHALEDHIERAAAWQALHGCKVPDIPR